MLPNAKTAFEESDATAVSSANGGSVWWGLGLGDTFHAAPFHRSTSVATSSPQSVHRPPTAVSRGR